MTKITVLVENTSQLDSLIKLDQSIRLDPLAETKQARKSKELKSEHGLSLYVEGQDKSFLFDFGASVAFEDNAKILGIDLKHLDFGFLSHGHYDHSGGLAGFCSGLDLPIYAHEEAFGLYYATEQPVESVNLGELQENNLRYIGVDQSLKTCPNIHRIDHTKGLYDGIYALTDGQGHQFNPSGNKRLLRQVTSHSEVRYVHDDFSHEQSLVLIDGDKCILFGGCAHSGIVNIIEAVKQQLGYQVTHIISGLHMGRKGNSESLDFIEGVGEYLKSRDIKVYTGHCTGQKPAEILKPILGQNLNLLHTGLTFEI